MPEEAPGPAARAVTDGSPGEGAAKRRLGERIHGCGAYCRRIGEQYERSCCPVTSRDADRGSNQHVSFLGEVLGDALRFVADFGPEVQRVLGLTLLVSGVATVIGAALGIPLGITLGLERFRGRGFLLAIVNTGMGIPPVLAGLLLLLLLWNDGPLGGLDLVFTPAAMIAAQALLALPIAAGVTAATVRNLSPAAHEQLHALRLTRWQRMEVAGREVWPGLVGATAAAFGRVVAEVGAVLVVGGNIAGETRVLTTAIVQEARQARFGAAVGLGIVLLVIALAVNGVLTWLQLRDGRHA